MATSFTSRGYPIPDATDAIHPAVRDALQSINTDVGAVADDPRLLKGPIAKASLPVTNVQPGTLAQVTDDIRGLWRRADSNNGWVSVSGVAHIKDFGAKVDGTTDDTAAWQTVLDNIATMGGDATIIVPRGVSIISGGLQDTSASNSQLVLPKQLDIDHQISIRIVGETPAGTRGLARAGSIIRSTLGSGTGSLFGVKTTATQAGVTGISFLSMYMQDVAIQTAANPTISALDFRYIPNGALRNVQINAAPDADIVEPTTSTSYGLKTPVNNLPDLFLLDNVQVQGFYSGILAGELIRGTTVVVDLCKLAVEMGENYHALSFDFLLVTNSVQALKKTGSGAVILNIELLDIDQNVGGEWWDYGGEDLSDPDNLVCGRAFAQTVVQDEGAAQIGEFVKDGGKNFIVKLLRKPHVSNTNWTVPVSGLEALNPSVLEIYDPTPTSTNDRLALLLAGSYQTGTANAVFTMHANNYSLPGDMRIASMGARTDGATDSAAMDFVTMNAGTRTVKLSLTKTGLNTPLAAIPVFANNAAAVTGGLVAGDHYRTGADPDQLCIVH